MKIDGDIYVSYVYLYVLIEILCTLFCCICFMFVMNVISMQLNTAHVLFQCNYSLSVDVKCFFYVSFYYLMYIFHGTIFPQIMASDYYFILLVFNLAVNGDPTIK